MRVKLSLLIIGIVTLCMACASEPVDIGSFNPDTLREEELVSVVIHRAIKVHSIDGIDVDWATKKKVHRVIKVPPGSHNFRVSFEYNGFYMLFPAQLIGDLEKGNTYLINFSLDTTRERQTAQFFIFLYNDNKKGDMISSS